MLFNSFEFAVFFLIVFLLYLFLSHKLQNRMLLVASCIFYGTWNWKFLFLMFFSISIDYFCALKISSSNDHQTRKKFLLISIISNLTILGFFKYFNFFIGNIQYLFSLCGLAAPIHALNIILPLGISFYTFEAMSYVIDVYRGEIGPTREYFDYALFVLFFPHLIAGPIMRAKNLLSQITTARQLTLDKFYEGCFLIFWGLFLKIYIADGLARIADPAFPMTAGPVGMSGLLKGSTVLLAIYAFAFQIYCDFLGYSTIARGLGKCMGFDIMNNFNLPYFSTNPREFWQRWHISLSTWLRDYLYIPLGGNKNGKKAEYRNIAITMFLGGLWHGASWTFVLWGMYQGLLLIIHRLLQPILKKLTFFTGALVARISFVLRLFCFFNLMCIGWLLFRAKSMTVFWYMAKSLLFNFHFDTGDFAVAWKMAGLLSVLLFVEVLQYLKSDLLIVLKLNPVIRAAFYLVCFYLLLFNGDNGGKAFIYFQF